MSTVRAFLAINLPMAILRRVTELQSELRTRADQEQLKVGWVPPPNLHVTLKFLGNISRENAWVMRDLLQQRLAHRPRFSLAVKGAGCFPDAAHPRILWVGVEGKDDALTALVADLEQWMFELGFAKEKRPFHAHVTIGRVKDGNADLLQGLNEPDFGRCTVNEVVLYESVLRRTGAEYSALVRVPLAGK